MTRKSKPHPVRHRAPLARPHRWMLLGAIVFAVLLLLVRMLAFVHFHGHGHGR